MGTRCGQLYLTCLILLILCVVNKTPEHLLHMCASSCGTLLVDMTVQSDSIVSPSIHVQWGSTPLLRAAQEGHVVVARCLLENGSNVHEQNNVGCVHLMLYSMVVLVSK